MIITSIFFSLSTPLSKLYFEIVCHHLVQCICNIGKELNVRFKDGGDLNVRYDWQSEIKMSEKLILGTEKKRNMCNECENNFDMGIAIVTQLNE